MLQLTHPLAAPPPFDATLTGTADDDWLHGSIANELLQGLDGDDLLQGLGGDDSLEGGAGDDTLQGGSGRDTMDGGGGHNVLSGGSGADYFVVHDLATTLVDGGSGNDTVLLKALDAGLDWNLMEPIDFSALEGVENLIGTRFNDQFTGGVGRNVLSGKGGDDYLQASDRNYHRNPLEVGDKLSGGIGNDSLVGQTGDDTLKGGAGNDHLYGDYFDGYDVMTVSHDLMLGGGGDDTFFISSGDTVDGGQGQDSFGILDGDNSLTGGAGADTFDFGYVNGETTSAFGLNLITDLETADTIDLHWIDANAAVAGDQAFTLVSALDGQPGQAALVYDSGADETALLLDTDGDGTADITIRLTGDQTGFTHFVL